MARFKNKFNLSASELDIFIGLRKEYSKLRARVKDREKRMKAVNDSLPNDKSIDLGLIIPYMRTLKQLDNFSDVTNQSYSQYLAKLNEDIAEAQNFLNRKENSSKTLKAISKHGRQAGIARYVANKMGVLTLDPQQLEYYSIGFAAIRELSERENWIYYSEIYNLIDIEALGEAIKNKDNNARLEYTQRALKEIAKIRRKLL